MKYRIEFEIGPLTFVSAREYSDWEDARKDAQAVANIEDCWVVIRQSPLRVDGSAWTVEPEYPTPEADEPSREG